MNDRRDDELIRERFQELRARVEASGRIPDFRAMVERARAEAADLPELRVLEGDAPSGDVATRSPVTASPAPPDAAAASGPIPAAATHAVAVATSSPGAARPVRARRRALVMGGWASAALAAGVAALLLLRQDGGNDEFERLVAAYTSDMSAGAWQSPTSELLEVPGSELLRSVPALGGSLGGLGAGPGAAAPPPEGGQDRL